MQAVPRRRLAHLQRLAQHSAERRKAGQFLIEGAVLVGDALDAGLRVIEVLLEESRAGAAEKAVVARARDGGATYLEVAEEALARIGASVTPPPLLAVAEIPGQHNLSEANNVLGLLSETGVSVGEGFEDGETKVSATELANATELTSEGFSLAAVEIADPSNAGALLRCAEGAGVSEVIFVGNCVDPWGPKVVRSSAGSVFRLPPRREPDVAAFLQGLQETGRQVVATASNRGNPYYEFSYNKGAVILVGNETRGLPEVAEANVTDWIQIPLAGGVESLNVAMAASVICFEAARQMAAKQMDAEQIDTEQIELRGAVQ